MDQASINISFKKFTCYLILLKNVFPSTSNCSFPFLTLCTVGTVSTLVAIESRAIQVYSRKAWYSGLLIS